MTPGEPPRVLLNLADPFIAADAAEHVERRLEAAKRVGAKLASVAAVLTEPGVPAGLRVRAGPLAQQSVRPATEVRITPAIPRSRARRRVEASLLGRAVENFTTHVPCPVLGVR